MRKLLTIVIVCLIAATAFAVDVFLGRQQDITWTGEGTTRVAQWGSVAPPAWTDPLPQLAWYAFEATNATQTLDLSGNGYNGGNMPTVATGPAWTTLYTNGNGRVEHGYTFDGADDGLKIADNTPMSFVSGTTDLPLTMAAWIYPHSFGSVVQIIVGKQDSVVSEWLFMTRPTSNLSWLTQNTGATVTWSCNTYTNSLALNTWYHVAVVSTGKTNATLYINGVTPTNTYILESGSYASRSDTVCKPYIGRREDTSNPRYFDGVIDDVRMYTQALTSAQILTLYQNTITNISTGY
jgi:hypothetical protein